MKIEIDKPVVPKFVADWIENIPEYYNVRGVLDLIGEDDAKDILDWCKTVDNYLTYETLVTAFLHGYEIEQEQIYYAKIKGWEKAKDNRYWNLTRFNGKLYPSNKRQDDYCQTKMTKEEWNALGINDTNADFEEV